MHHDRIANTWQEPKWYILFVRSNQEKRIADGLSSRDVEHFLPCYSSVRQWKDRRVKLAVPLFPGYLFVRIALAERMRALTVPNVVSLVGSGKYPSEMSETEIGWIKAGVERGDARPHSYLKEGDRVVITKGVMAGMEGILSRNEKCTKVIVSLDSIFRAFKVAVSDDSIQPAAGPVSP